MTEQDSGGRMLSYADILRPCDNDLEAALVASANRWIEDVARQLPDLTAARGSVGTDVDADAVLGQLSTLAWSGVGSFEAIAPSDGNSPVLSVSSPWDISEQLRSGTAVIARQVQAKMPSIAELHDSLTAAWNAKLSVSIIITSSDTEVHVPLRTALLVVEGSARLSSSDSEPTRIGSLRIVPSGPVSISTNEFTVLVAFEIQEFGPRSILEQLSRSASHNPLFRADLPRQPEVQFTSYGGSLLDEPGALARAALAIYDEGVPQQARCWWNATLRFAVGSLDTYARFDRWRLRWPAPPAFGDRRLGWSGNADDLVIAMAGHVVAIAPDLHGELLDLAAGGSLGVETPLFRVFADLGLLVPA